MPSFRILAQAAGLLLLAGAAAAQSPPASAPVPEGAARKGAITLELNKLEPGQAGCRAYFVVENRSAEPVREVRLDTFIFDGAGLISRRIGLTFSDLRPDRTKVVPFDLAGAACPDIGRLLVSDVLACLGPSGAPVPGCGDLLAVSTRASAKFEY